MDFGPIARFALLLVRPGMIVMIDGWNLVVGSIVRSFG